MTDGSGGESDSGAKPQEPNDSGVFGNFACHNALTFFYCSSLK